jgi:hypothetical protein
MRTLLSKMLRDKKNSDFHDQIYYAFGNIEMHDGNTNKALEYYKKSVQSSKGNAAQKTLSCLTLANFYYDHKIYIPSQAYYDTALISIDSKYPNIDQIKVKAGSLNRLVQNLNTISREDSLQKIAKLPEAQRSQLIQKIISDLRQQEEEEKQAEAARLQEYYNNQSRQAMLGQNSGQQSTKWYFYNPVSVAQGTKDFQLKWGKRKLEDNWRRKNKAISEFIGDPEAMAEEETADKGKKKVVDNKTPEFYTQNLPLTDSAKQVSTQRVINSYYEGGLVYRNELKDLSEAIALYEKMMQRFPTCEYNTTVYYQLYSMNVDQRNEGRAAYYKNLILSQFPNSTAAKIISDTTYYKQVLIQEKVINEYYEKTYALYNSGNYAQVIANTTDAFNRFKDDKALPRFAMLKALSIGKTTDPMTFRKELNKIVSDYPKHEVATYAKSIISYLNTAKPETKVEEEVKAAEVTYLDEPNNKTWILTIVVEKKEDVNQIVFDLINFNLDNFPNDKYDINNEEMGKTLKTITIRPFPDKAKSLAYLRALENKPETFKNVKGDTKQMFIISPSNYDILKKQPSADTYLQFFLQKLKQ